MSLLENLIVSLEADIDEYKRNMNQAQEETDNFAKGVNKSNAGVKTSTDEVSKSTKKNNEEVKSLKDQYTSLVSEVGTVVAISYSLKKGFDATIGEFASYALKVDKFTSALDTTSEQGSRLIQIADDLGIQSDQLQADLFRAVKGGMDPTVAGLADMADKFNALATPQEKADFLQKNFGRSSQDLVRLLAEGSAGIYARNTAVESSLILDEKAIGKQREYEASMDDATDAIKAFKVELGGEAIPVVTKSITAVTQMTKINQKLTKGVWETLTPLEKMATWTLAGPIGDFRILFGMFPGAKAETEALLDSMQTGVLTTNKAVSETDVLFTRFGGNIGVVTAYQDAYNKAIEEGKAVNEAETLAIAATNDELGRQAKAAEEAGQAIVKIGVEGQLAKAFRDAQPDIDQYNRSLKYFMNLQKNGPAILENMRNKLEEVQAQFGANSDEYKKARDQLKLTEEGYAGAGGMVNYFNGKLDEENNKLEDVIKNMIYQQTVSSLDAAGQLELARSLGLLSEQDYSVAKSLLELKNKYDLNRDGVVIATEKQEEYLTKIELTNAAIEYARTHNIPVTQDYISNYIANHYDNYYSSGTPPPGYGPGSNPPSDHKPGDVKVPGHYEDKPYPHWVPTTYWAQGGPVMGGQMGVWNEDVATRPEIFVGPEGGGYILTKQDAQDALWDKLKNAFEVNPAKGAGGTTVQVGGIHIHVDKDASLVKVGRAAEQGVLRALRAAGAA